eukprot:365383-Chlamydomonas_euryale.AAC.14
MHTGMHTPHAWAHACTHVRTPRMGLCGHVQDAPQSLPAAASVPRSRRLGSSQHLLEAWRAAPGSAALRHPAVAAAAPGWHLPAAPVCSRPPNWSAAAPQVRRLSRRVAPTLPAPRPPRRRVARPSAASA